MLQQDSKWSHNSHSSELSPRRKPLSSAHPCRLPTQKSAGLEEPHQRNPPPFAPLTSCPVGSSKIWGFQEVVDSAELTRAMSGIQHGCPCGKHFPYILTPQLTTCPTRVCTHSSVHGLEASRAIARSGGKRRASLRKGIQRVDFAPSLPKTGSCSSQQLQDAGFVHREFLCTEAGEDGGDHSPLPIHLGVCPDAVGDGRAPGQPGTLRRFPQPEPSQHAQSPRLREAWHSRADNPNPHSLLHATALRESPEPQSPPPLLGDTGKQLSS